MTDEDVTREAREIVAEAAYEGCERAEQIVERRLRTLLARDRREMADAVEHVKAWDGVWRCHRNCPACRLRAKAKEIAHD